MEIIVEVGTDEQKDFIKSEISLVYSLIDEYELPIKLHQLIIPQNFDNTIRELSGDKSYESMRSGQIAIAKIIYVPQGVSIVFSPLLYTEQYDFQVRTIYYCHELFHALTKVRFKSYKVNSQSKKTYLLNMNIIFDEYYVNRKSFEVVDLIAKPKTFYLKRFINYTFFGHIKSLLRDDYYLKIREYLYMFRLHRDVNFLNQIHPFYDEISKDIVYAYSFMDHFERLKRIEPLLSKSKMVNKKALTLINFFRQKYESDDTDLEDGFEIMEDYMTNFGIKFKDIPDGIYCEVLDI